MLTLEKQVVKPEMFISLPEYCNTPDGMTLDEAGNIILSCPNLNVPRFPGVLMKITPDNRLEFLYNLPAHLETRRVAPMDLEFGPDGNLYICDNQYFYDKNRKSRLLRLVMDNGRPVRAEVCVLGFFLANAPAWKENDIYITDSYWQMPGVKRSSAILRISLEEMQDGPVGLRPGEDPHVLADFSTEENEWGVDAGCDGLAFDSKGNLFTGIFGDGKMYKITFTTDGSVRSKEVFMRDKVVQCIDGIYCDKRTDNIFVADSKSNSIHVVTPKAEVFTLWENDDTTGEDGTLDQPCEPLIRKDKLIISNFDMPFPGFKNSGFSAPYTLSIMDIPEQFRKQI